MPRVAEVGAIPLRGLSSAGVAPKGPMAIRPIDIHRVLFAFFPKGVKVKWLIRLMILMILGGKRSFGDNEVSPPIRSTPVLNRS